MFLRKNVHPTAIRNVNDVLKFSVYQSEIRVHSEFFQTPRVAQKGVIIFLHIKYIITSKPGVSSSIDKAPYYTFQTESPRSP